MSIDAMRTIMEGLIHRLEPSLRGDALGEVLSQLLWLTDDNGSDVVTVCREWLSSDDSRRVEAALSLEDCWLFDDRRELETQLGRVRDRWPHLASRVDEILDSYDRQ